MTRSEFARMQFENAGREITQTFEIMNSNTALATGTLAALLAVLGAGELFGPTSPRDSLPRLSSVTLLVLAATLPLLWRFFIRSCTAYENLLRFNDIQREAAKYLNGESNWTAFEVHNNLFWRDWKARRPFRSVLWHNLQYGFMWIFLIAIGVLVWAFVSSEGGTPRIVAAVLLAVAAVWEGPALYFYRRNTVPTPNTGELEELRLARALPIESQSEGLREAETRSVPDGILEQTKGVFVGRRRLVSRKSPPL